MSNGNQTHAIILDFSKAFDKVSHRKLLYKLDFYGLCGKVNNWISAFLSDRKQAVIVDGEISDTLPVLSGVPQGTVLGPILFLLYINDLPEAVTSKVRLFADDAILYRKINGQDDMDRLQDDLTKLAQWEEDWSMSFNPEKCNSIRFTRSKNPFNKTYSLHDVDLVDVKSANTWE